MAYCVHMCDGTHMVQCVAVCCSVLQCAAVCCSVLQCVAYRVMTCFERRFDDLIGRTQFHVTLDSFMCVATHSCVWHDLSRGTGRRYDES